jgi:hypothetical protein
MLTHAILLRAHDDFSYQRQEGRCEAKVYEGGKLFYQKVSYQA